MRTNKFIPFLVAFILHAIPLFYYSLKNTKQSFPIADINKVKDIQGIEVNNFSLAKKRQGQNIAPSENNLKPRESVGFSGSQTMSTGVPATQEGAAMHFLEMSEPLYPPMARKNGLEGKVKAKAIYNSDGEITQVEILESSGVKILDESVKKTLLSWKLSKGSSGTFEKNFEFRLSN